MSEIKWIKIVTDVFDDEKMYAIECMQDGWTIELVWFKILCLAGRCNCNGFLLINNKLPYTDEMLSKAFRMDIGIIQRALDTFQSLEMIEVVDNAYMVSNWLMYQSGDRLEEYKEQHRLAQKRYREKQKLKLEEKKSDITSDVTNDNTSSLSISIKTSNVSKYLYLLDTSNEEYISYINNNIEVKECIETWMTYKDEKKNKYQETSIKSLLKKVWTNCLQYGNRSVISAIEDSMSNNYQGIVWDYLNKPKTQEKDIVNEWRNA